MIRSLSSGERLRLALPLSSDGVLASPRFPIATLPRRWELSRRVNTQKVQEATLLFLEATAAEIITKKAQARKEAFEALPSTKP